MPGQRIGLLGANGAGKSTLIRSIAGELTPRAGQRHTGEHLRIGYFAQHQLEALDPLASPFLHVQRLSPQASEQSIRDFLGGYGFHGDQALAVVGTFSGGEQARVALALVAWQRPNLLLLDEPTNHLDLEMRHALTLALSEYEGAMVLVSHDRHLLRTTCDSFCLVSDGGLKPFDGDLDDYRKWLDQPTTVKVSPQETAKAAAPRRAGDRNLAREIEQLERRMAQLTEEKARLDARLADPATYQSADKAALQKSTARQAEVVRLLGEAEEKWLVLHEELEKQ